MRTSASWKLPLEVKQETKVNPINTNLRSEAASHKYEATAFKWRKKQDNQLANHQGKEQRE